MRVALTGLVVVALGTAPYQCKHDPEPGVAREDSPGDAIYALAQDFRAKGNEEAARQSLRFLVEHYPSNRHAPAARAELDEAPRAAADASTPRAP